MILFAQYSVLVANFPYDSLMLFLGTWICHICVNGKSPYWKTSESSSIKKSTAASSTQSATPNGKILKYGLIRKKYDYKTVCKTPGCDGSGNINPTMSNHRR